MRTTTKSVYRDEFELLELMATDADGNTFSSLRGLDFQWWIESNNEKEVNDKEGKVGKDIAAQEGRNILQIVPFKGSQQEVDPTVMQMELKVCKTILCFVSLFLFPIGFTIRYDFSTGNYDRSRHCLRAHHRYSI